MNELETIIKELVKGLSINFSDFEGLYLYGSSLHKPFREANDIDIIALFNDVNYNKDKQIYGIVGDIEYKHDVFIDLHSMKKRDLKKNYMLFDDISKKGIFYEST